MEGYADRVDESVAPMVPDDRVNAEEEFRPSVCKSLEFVIYPKRFVRTTCSRLGPESTRSI
jgi:hypothetical protein